ncbi:MAG: hypothetical protein SCJ93_07725 [Bacillota bacterium]|nr:hypothetical protein [Bacillota bacterium]
MFNYENYDVEKIIYESNFQRILLCKNEDDELFYNNIILRERLIELIDKDFYPNNSDNLIAIEETEDRLYIYSKYSELEKITEFINNNELTYRERVEITENLLKKFVELEKYSDIQVQSMIIEDNLLIDNNNNIIFKNLLIFDQDYDIEESILMKITSNYIHYIFAGEFIKEFNISEQVPPDIKKIIIRASSKEYGSIGELIDSFKKSPTYTLILPLMESKNTMTTREDEEEILEETKNKENKKRFIIPIIIAVILIPIIIMIFFNNNNEQQEVNSEQENPENQTPNEQIIPEENQAENNDTMPETILSFYNEETIKDNSEDYAKIDFSKFYDGYYSLKIEDEEKENKKYLFAIIDLNDEEYSYLKNREVGISTRFTSDKAIEGNWIIEVRKNGEISNITNEKTSINDNSWIIKQRSLTLGDNDEIKLFFQYDVRANVWIDSIEIDVLK